MSRVSINSMSGFFYAVFKTRNWPQWHTWRREDSFNLVMHLVLLQSCFVARTLNLLRVISLGAVPVSEPN